MASQVYYSTSTVAYQPTPYLQQTFVPHPASGTRLIRMRIPDDLTQTLYDKLINGEITDNISLNEFLAGFAFISKSTGNTFIGITTNPSVSGLRLYYHDTDLNKTAATLLFPITSLHFTKLQNDRTGTPLAALKNKSDAVSSRLTNGTTVIALGAGLQTRIEFPYLNDFFRPEKFADLNRALLVISPVRGDLRDNTPPPLTLQVYQTNNQNEFIATIPGGPTGGDSGGAGYFIDQSSILPTDSYTIDLTYYIGQIIKRKASAHPLLLTVPAPSSGPFTLKALVQRINTRRSVPPPTTGCS